MKLTPKNWSEFQHYKDRSPAWIKLHRSLLDDFAFQRLPVASRALAPMLWLLASEYENGVIEASPEELAFRLRMRDDDLISALKPLIDAGFFSDASGALADCKHDACLEKRREEEETEREKEKSETRARAKDDFEKWYAEYPHKVGRQAAFKAFATAIRKATLDELVAGVRRYIREKPPDRQWCNPATWLNQERWKDQPAQVREAVNGKSQGNVVAAADRLLERVRAFDQRPGGIRDGTGADHVRLLSKG